MLMAAALLISTNAGAAIINVPSDMSLKQAIESSANGDEIVITENPYDINITTAANQINLNADKHIKLNLNNSMIRINNTTAAKNAGIAITRGILEITGNGTIANANASGETKYTSDLIRVYGTDATVADPKLNTPYSQVIVGANVTIQNLHYLNNSTKTEQNPTGWNKDVKCNAISITEEQSNAKIYANGARVDVYGTLNASTYCVKVNGSIQKPDPTTMSPYVYIHTGATLTSDANKPNAVAAYSSGYGRWLIEGTCSGSTGLYAKGGSVEIAAGSHILSERDEVTVPTGQTSGVNAGGSAIVIESNAAYPGDIEVVITGGKIEATSGYAIEETVTTATSSEVETISIQGGTIDGGDAGAIIIKDETTGKTTVSGGTIDGNVTAGTTVVNGVEAMTTFLPGGNNDEGAFTVEVEQDTETGQYVYSVVPDKSKVVNINDFGWSTFSANELRKVPAGVTAYIAKYESGDAITLTPLTKDIPANTGVILFGSKNAVYTLSAETPLNPGDPATISAGANQLVAASEWGGTLDKGIYTNVAKDNVYVLVGNELYKYTGNQMKANKAYLQLGQSGPYGAPKRIQMVVAETEETQAVDNVETTIEAVKFMENGQIFIRRGENIYNVQGQIVK